MSPQKEELQEQLSAYLDGELSDAQARRLEQELAKNPDLAAGLESLRKVASLVNSLPREAVPDDLADRVLDRVERGRLLDGAAEEMTRPSGWWLGRMATAAIVLIAVGLGTALVAKLATPSWEDRHTRSLAGNTETDRTGEELAAAGDAVDARGARTTATDPVAPAKSGRGLGEGDTYAYQLAGARDRTVGLDLGWRKDLDSGRKGPVRYFCINTDNIVLAQADVERILISNGIVRADAAPADRRSRSRGVESNVYNQTALVDGRVEDEVARTPDQVRDVYRQLQSIRLAQGVPQTDARGERAGAVGGAEVAAMSTPAAPKGEHTDKLAAVVSVRGGAPKSGPAIPGAGYVPADTEGPSGHGFYKRQGDTDDRDKADSDETLLASAEGIAPLRRAQIADNRLLGSRYAGRPDASGSVVSGKVSRAPATSPASSAAYENSVRGRVSEMKATKPDVGLVIADGFWGSGAWRVDADMDKGKGSPDASRLAGRAMSEREKVLFSGQAVTQSAPVALAEPGPAGAPASARPASQPVAAKAVDARPRGMLQLRIILEGARKK